MQIKDVRNNLVQGTNKTPYAAPAKINAAPSASSVHEPQDVVLLSDHAKTLARSLCENFLISE